MSNRSSRNDGAGGGRGRNGDDARERVSLTAAAEDIDGQGYSFKKGSGANGKGGKQVKSLKSLEEDDIDLEFEKWADELSVRQRKRQDRQRVLTKISVLAGLALLLFVIIVAVVVSKTSNKGHSHKKEVDSSVVSVCESQSLYKDWCKKKTDNAEKEWQAIKDKRKNGSLTLELLIGHLDTALFYLKPAMDLSDLYSNVAVSESCRSSAKQCRSKASDTYLKGYSDPEILEAIEETIHGTKLNPEYVKLIDDTVRILHNNGAGLAGNKSEGFLKMTTDEVKFVGEFDSLLDTDERYVSRPANDDTALEGLSADFIDELTEGGVVKFGTVYTDLDPVLDFAVNETLRKDLLTVYLNRGTPDNLQTLQALLSTRQSIAKAINKTSWAQMQSEGLMLHDEDDIENFLHTTYDALIDPANTYKEALLQLKAAAYNSTGQVLDPNSVWQYDRDYWKGVLQKSLFNYSADGLAKHLAYSKVKGALFGVFKDVYDVQLISAPDEYKWDPSVEVYVAKNASTQEVMGYLYLDLWPRDDKFKHAATFPMIQGLDSWEAPFARDESVHRAAIVCNFPHPPNPMLFSDVVTFFHESGHFLHGLMASQNQRYATFSGIQTEFDFIESPSQFMESYAYDNRTLQAIDPNIPHQYVSSFIQANRLGRAQSWQQQLFYAQLSWVLHKNVSITNTTDVVIELQGQYSPFPYIPDTHMQAGFGHLTGYSSKYFVYLWSKAMALQIYDFFTSSPASTADGLYNVEIAHSYRDIVLRPGGSQSATDYMEKFLGHKPVPTPFFKWLQESVDLTP